MHTCLFTCSVALLTATILTPLVINWARRNNCVDKPGVRKIHTEPISRLGGIAIYIATILGILSALVLQNAIGEKLRSKTPEMLTLLSGSTMIFVVGLYDDLKQLRARTKLTLQLIIVTAVCTIGGISIDRIVIHDWFTIEFGWLSYPITLIWIVGICNAFNLIDGLDGLAAGIAGIACGVISLLSIWQGNTVLAVVMLALLGALIGFLFFNFHPARIFMGDSGSLFLGYVIAVASVITASKSEALVGLGLPILVLGIPIIDMLLAILRRFLQRRGIMSADRGHFHHKLLDLGFKQQHIAIVAYLITLIISGFGFFMLITNSTGSVLILVNCLVLLLLAFRLAGSVQLHQIFNDIRKRAELAHTCHMERQKFEESELYFHNIHTLKEWWDCMCQVASYWDFSRLSLYLNGRRDYIHSCSTWSVHRQQRSWSDVDKIIRMRIPLTCIQGDTYAIEMEIPIQGSIESAGRKAALLTRLIEQHSPERLFEDERLNIKSDADVDSTKAVQQVAEHVLKTHRECPSDVINV